MNPADVLKRLLDAEAVQANLGALESLLRSPGWVFLEAFLRAQEEGAYNSLHDTDNATILAKSAGVARTAREARLWPQKQLEALQDFVAKRRKP